MSKQKVRHHNTTTMTKMSLPSSSSSSGLQSSPAARAFFEALDHSQKGECGNGIGGRKKHSTSSSSFIQKRIQTLGWRNRFSQDDYYPIQVQVADAVVGSSSFSFRVLQVQRGELEGTYGTGATVWPASVVLVKYLELHAKALLEGKRVIDLGAGTGITSIAAALLGAKHVVCTDGECKVVELSRDNIRHAAKQLQELEYAAEEQDEEEDESKTRTATTMASSPSTADEHDSVLDEVALTIIRGCPVQAQQYWWGSGPLPGAKTHANGDDNGDDEASCCCDVVLVSDCVLPKLYPIAPLVEALDELLVKPMAFAIVSYEHRYYPEYDPREKFQELANAKRLQVTIIPMDEHHPVYSVDDIELWRVERQA